MTHVTLSNNPLIIAQVTDIHIPRIDQTVKGVPIRQQFLQVIERLKNKSLDLLVLSGDLAAEAGEIESYEWIKSVLSDFPCPYIVMMGNHDEANRMAQIFNLPAEDIHGTSLYFKRTFKGKELFFLDSATYRISPEQLQWLHTELHGKIEPVLLFIHHPPHLCHCRFMDTGYPLANIDETWPLLAQLPAIQAIFCGHYHTEKTVVVNGKQIYITPSTFFQIDKYNPEFTIEHTRPAWRIIEWHQDALHTYVDYIY